MSDKTCGNCYHCVPRHGTRFRKLDGVCLYTGYAVDTQSTSPVTPCGNHRMWRERKNTLEQRYEQLEQVARDLYNSAWTSEFLRMCAEMPHADRELKERVADGWLQNEREKLRELGVRLDD